MLADTITQANPPRDWVDYAALGVSALVLLTTLLYVEYTRRLVKQGGENLKQALGLHFEDIAPKCLVTENSVGISPVSGGIDELTIEWQIEIVRKCKVFIEPPRAGPQLHVEIFGSVDGLVRGPKVIGVRATIRPLNLAHYRYSYALRIVEFRRRMADVYRYDLVTRNGVFKIEPHANPIPLTPKRESL